MSRQQDKPYAPQRAAAALLTEAPSAGWRAATALLQNLALQDWALLLMFATLSWRAFMQARGAEAPFARAQAGGLLLTAVVMLVLTRGELIGWRAARAVLYRVGMLTTMTASYLILRWLLPALQPELLDGRLLAMDTLLFGATPAIALQPLVNPASVEWFAFFYFTYYYLLAGHLIGTLIFDRGRRQYELLLGAALIAAIGHTGYTFVPGVGPFAYGGMAFDVPLSGGAWWARMQETVASAGAGLDIFPSLHTALSLLMAMHAFRHRRARVYRWTWIPTCFWTANIIVATVFLRWHYGIDLIAGTILAVGTHRFAIHNWQREGQRARGDGRQAVWEPVSSER